LARPQGSPGLRLDGKGRRCGSSSGGSNEPLPRGHAGPPCKARPSETRRRAAHPANVLQIPALRSRSRTMVAGTLSPGNTWAASSISDSFCCRSSTSPAATAAAPIRLTTKVRISASLGWRVTKGTVAYTTHCRITQDPCLRTGSRVGHGFEMCGGFEICPRIRAHQPVVTMMIPPG